MSSRAAGRLIDILWLRRKVEHALADGGELPGEVVRAPAFGNTVVQRLRRRLVGARRAADAKVDAARVEGLEHAELLGHHERGVVREHHAARADPDGPRGIGDVADEDRRRGTRDAWHAVVLGHPEPGEAQVFCLFRQVDRGPQRVAGGGAVGDRGQVEHSQGNAGEGQGKVRVSHASGQRVPAARSSVGRSVERSVRRSVRPSGWSSASCRTRK